MKLMNKLGLFTGSDLKNIIETKHERGMRTKITIEQLERTKADIQQWRLALAEAEDEDYPDRTELIRLYQEILLDDVVSGFVEGTKNRILASEFDIVDQNDEIQPDKISQFDANWFVELVEHFVMAELVGYRLLEIFPANGTLDVFKGIFHFPDHYLIPQWRELMRSEGQFNNTISYDPLPFSVLELGGNTDKGLLNSIYPLYVYKKNAYQLWANFQKKFGVPPAVGKTDLANEAKRKDMYEFLKTFSSASIGVIGEDDEILSVSTNGVDGYNTFDKMIDKVDTKILRRLEGQNMTSEEGSSRSQAEVHQEVGDIWFYGRLNKFRRLMNDRVIPILAEGGFNLAEGDRMRFKDNKDISKIIDQIVKLKQAGFSIDAEWVEETTGYPVEAYMQEVSEPVEPGNSIMGELDELYKSMR